jgi:uridylate kinase
LCLRTFFCIRKKCRISTFKAVWQSFKLIRVELFRCHQRLALSNLSFRYFMQKKFKRILLKLSGEAFAGTDGHGIDFTRCEKLARALEKMQQEGVEIAIVVGAGNLFRGGKRVNKLCSRVAADQIGLLATVMNGTALCETLIRLGLKARHASAIGSLGYVEAYTPLMAQEALSQGSIVVLSGGTGNPFFTTDTAAALRAKELQADLLLKATNVSGVFDRDPHIYSDAKQYKEVSFTEVLRNNLNVMDMTAFALCRTESMPVFVFDLNLLFSTSLHAIVDDLNGTLVKGEL